MPVTPEANRGVVEATGAYSSVRMSTLADRKEITAPGRSRPRPPAFMDARRGRL
jgi:hypothetical protein